MLLYLRNKFLEVIKLNLIKCKKCGIDFCEGDVEFHHIVPKVIGGVDLDGRVYLCHKHHNILYSIILKWIMDSVPENLKEPIKEKIKEKTRYYLGNNSTTAY